jgi:hypothetical protein
MKRYTLPDLAYDYSALEPHLSAQVLELHHDKHHRVYVDGANRVAQKLAEARERSASTPHAPRRLRCATSPRKEQRSPEHGSRSVRLRRSRRPAALEGGGSRRERRLLREVSSSAALRRRGSLTATHHGDSAMERQYRDQDRERFGWRGDDERERSRE